MNAKMEKEIEEGKRYPVKRWVVITSLLGFAGGVIVWLFTVIFWVAGQNSADASQQKDIKALQGEVTTLKKINQEYFLEQKEIKANLKQMLNHYGLKWIDISDGL